jgi:hypothetical protein
MPDIGVHQQQVEHNRQTTAYLQQAGDNYSSPEKFFP